MPLNKYKLQSLIFLTFFVSFIIKILNTEYFFIGSDIAGHIQASISLRESSILETVNMGNNFLVRLGVFTHGYTMLFLNWLSYEFYFEILRFKVNESSFIKLHSLISTMLLIPVYLFLNKHLNKRETLLAILIISLIPVHIFISRSYTGPVNFSIGFFFLTMYWLDNLIKKINNKNIIFFSLSSFFYIGSSNLFLLGFFFHLIYLLIFAENLTWNKVIEFIFKVYFNIYSTILIILPIILYLLVTIHSINNDVNSGFILRIFNKTNNLGIDFYKVKFIFEYYGPIIIIFFYNVLMDLYERKINQISYFFLIYIIIFSTLIIITDSEPSYFITLVVPISYVIMKNFKKTNKYMFGLFLILNLFYSSCYVYGYPFIFPHNGDLSRVSIGTYNPKFSFDNGQKAASYLLRKKIINPGFTIIRKKYFGNIKKPNVYTKKSLDVSTAYYLNDEVFYFDQFDLNTIGNNNYVFLYPYKIMDIKKIDFLNKKNNLKLLVNICENNKKIIGIYGNINMRNLTNECLDSKKLNNAFENEYFSLKDFSKLYLGVF
jgi:hypothetical protein